MGIVISILSFSLILLYRNSILPVQNITRQLQQTGHADIEISLEAGSSLEILELARAIAERVENAQTLDIINGDDTIRTSYSTLVEHINGSTNQLNGLINYAQLLADTDEHLYSAQQRELLDKIIETTTDIEKAWKQF
jgi:hypothetical protein